MADYLDYVEKLPPPRRDWGPPIKDLTGQTFGRWTVIFMWPERNKWGRICYLCRCECGVEKVVNGNNLSRGITLSCGCYNLEALSRRMTTHGMTTHELYGTWHAMIARCHNPKHESYNYYGARGIVVWEAWHDTATFIKDILAEIGPRPNGKTLDRIDNNGNYAPGNVRWSTALEQSNNTRKNINITYNGETRTLHEWCDTLDFQYMTAWSRYIRGVRDPELLFASAFSKARNRYKQAILDLTE